MKAKRFKEFILESREAKVEWDDTKLWFDEETDFRELLGQDIWQIRVDDSITEDGLFSIVKKIKEDLAVEAKPIILTNRGYKALWFSLDRNILAEQMEGWQLDLEPARLRDNLDLFKSNASGISNIISRAGSDLGTEQLVQLVGWLEENSNIKDEFKGEIIGDIKAHPNWPEDMTDWALGDW